MLIGQMELLLPEEKEKVISKWNETAKSEKLVSLQDMFEKQAVLTPERIALMCDDIQVNYRKLNEEANRLARLLIEKGIGPEQFVALRRRVPLRWWPQCLVCSRLVRRISPLIRSFQPTAFLTCWRMRNLHAS